MLSVILLNIIASYRTDIGFVSSGQHVKVSYQSENCCKSDCNITAPKLYDEFPFSGLEGCNERCCTTIFPYGYRWLDTTMAQCHTPQAWGIVADFTGWKHPGISSGFVQNTNINSPRAVSICNSLIYNWASANSNMPGKHFVKGLMYYFMMEQYYSESDSILDQMKIFDIEKFYENPRWYNQCDDMFDDFEEPISDYYFLPPGQYFREQLQCVFVAQIYSLSYCGDYERCLAYFGFADTEIGNEINECVLNFNLKMGQIWSVGNHSVVLGNQSYLDKIGINKSEISDKYQPKNCPTRVKLPNGTFVEIMAQNTKFIGWNSMFHFLAELPFWGSYGFGAHTFYLPQVQDKSLWNGVNWPAVQHIKGMICDPTCPDTGHQYRCTQLPENCTRTENPNFCVFN